SPRAMRAQRDATCELTFYAPGAQMARVCAMRVEPQVRPMDARDPRPTETNDAASPPSTPRPTRTFFVTPEVISNALEAGNIGVWAWDIQTNRVTWSANLEQIHRLPQGRFEGTFAAFENDVHPEDRAAVRAAIEDSLRSHKPYRALYRLPPAPDSDERWLESVGAVIVEDGRPVRMVGTCRDVTERVTLHRELRARASHQEAVARLGERALTERDLQKFFDEAVAMVARTLDVELVKILELVPGDAELLLRSGVGWKPGRVGAAYISTGRETHAGFTLASGGPVIVDNLPTETRFVGAPLLREHDAVSGISAPIAGRDGRAYGVLTAPPRTRRRFGGYEVSFLASVASVIAGAIARLHQDRRQDLMIRELRHRSGNLYSQLLALFSQTAKNSRTIEELSKK